MDKGKSDRGGRTEESGVDESIPVADATAGDEGIDDASGAQPFRSGQPKKYAPAISNDVDPERMGSLDEGKR